jgi:prevent-host-death family protein
LPDSIRLVGDWSIAEPKAMKQVGAYEAKTKLGKLLEEVAAGETIVITKHGLALAVLSPATGSRAAARAAAAGLLEFRANHRLDGVSIRELIEDGRQ